MRVYISTDEQALPAQTGQEELRDLLFAIRDVPQHIAIQLCPTLEALVAWLYCTPPNLPFVVAPENPARRLYYAMGRTDHDVESLCRALWTEHEEYILERRFSREEVQGPDGLEYDWVGFKPTDREQIRASLQTAPPQTQVEVRGHAQPRDRAEA